MGDLAHARAMTTRIAFVAMLLAALLAPTPDRAAAADTADPVGVWPLVPAPEVVRAFDPPEDPWGAGHRGVDLLGLPAGTLLRLGESAVVEVTGLRNPCVQLDRFQHGLMRRLVGRDADGRVVRRAGVMGVVRQGGEVRPGDPIGIELPEGPHRPLDVV